LVSVDEDARHFGATARRLGYDVAPSSWASFATAQSVFLTSHFEALRPRWLESAHRLGTAYLHGRPGTEGYPEFDRAFEALRSAPERFSRIQVTHGEMRDLVLGAGVEPGAVHLIPIGIDLKNFPLATPERCSAARARFGVSMDAFEMYSRDIQGRRRGIRAANRPETEMDALFREELAHEKMLLGGSQYASQVGAFEGANYEARGFFRPEVDCIMFTRNTAGFCAVCRRAIQAILDLYSR
jgi:hypothetical protein